MNARIALKNVVDLADVNGTGVAEYEGSVAGLQPLKQFDARGRNIEQQRIPGSINLLVGKRDTQHLPHIVAELLVVPFAGFVAPENAGHLELLINPQVVAVKQ